MASVTIPQLFEERVAEGGDSVALRVRRDASWVGVTWSEWHDAAVRVAAGLAELGVLPGERVAIVMRTRLEWLVLDIAIAMIGAVSVPVYPTVLPRQLRIVLEHADASWLVVEDPHQLEKWMSIAGEVASIRQVILVDDIADLETPDRLGRCMISISQVQGVVPMDRLTGWAGLLERGGIGMGRNPNLVFDRRRDVLPDDVASLVYTSGTTGRPRGVVLSHRAFVAQAHANALVLPIGPEDEQLLFLPLSHVFARVAYLTAVRSGTVTWLSKGASTLRDDLRDARPTIVVAVPRVFERIHADVVAEIDTLSTLRRGAARRAATLAVEMGRRASSEPANGSLSLRERVETGLFARRFFERVRDAFGGRVRYAICGGAPLSTELTCFFRGCGVSLLEAYGQTETCGAVAMSRPDRCLPGTSGPALPGIEIRLAEDGEVLVRGRTLMTGYWKDEEATEEAFDGDWLRTGDVGEFNGPFLRVTDRKQDVLLTTAGKRIAPQPIEAMLRTIPWVEHAVVCGEGRPWLVALLALRADTVAAWADEQRLQGAEADRIASHPRVHEWMARAIEQMNAELAPHEAVRRFAILDESFELSSGELTPTWKTRRRFVHEKYRAVIDGLYAEASHGFGRGSGSG